jgi:hypothetical protein
LRGSEGWRERGDGAGGRCGCLWLRLGDVCAVGEYPSSGELVQRPRSDSQACQLLHWACERAAMAPCLRQSLPLAHRNAAAVAIAPVSEGRARAFWRGACACRAVSAAPCPHAPLALHLALHRRAARCAPALARTASQAPFKFVHLAGDMLLQLRLASQEGTPFSKGSSCALPCQAANSARAARPRMDAGPHPAAPSSRATCSLTPRSARPARHTLMRAVDAQRAEMRAR